MTVIYSKYKTLEIKNCIYKETANGLDARNVCYSSVRNFAFEFVIQIINILKYLHRNSTVITQQPHYLNSVIEQ